MGYGDVYKRQIEGDTPAESEVRYKVQIFDEVLSFAYLSDKEKIRKSALIDTRTAEVLSLIHI